MSKQVQFIGLEPNDLAHDLSRILIPQLKAQLAEEFQPKEPTAYLTRHQVCEWLSIDLSTLWKWTKKGLIPSYGIGGRVYYKRCEIEAYINNQKTN